MPFAAFCQTSYMRVPFTILMALAGLFALSFWLAAMTIKFLPISINFYLPKAWRQLMLAKNSVAMTWPAMRFALKGTLNFCQSALSKKACGPKLA